MINCAIKKIYLSKLKNVSLINLVIWNFGIRSWKSRNHLLIIVNFKCKHKLTLQAYSTNAELGANLCQVLHTLRGTLFIIKVMLVFYVVLIILLISVCVSIICHLHSLAPINAFSFLFLVFVSYLQRELRCFFECIYVFIIKFIQCKCTPCWW